MTTGATSEGLVNQVPLEADESCSGYVTRLTERNYYESPKWILDLCGAKPATRSVKSQRALARALDLSALSVLSGEKLERLERLSGVEGGGKLGPGEDLFFGNVIPADWVDLQNAKFCPHCLREEEYARKAWDLAAVTACPVHGVVLVDRCPECESPIEGFRTSISYCSCGGDLRNAPVAMATERELWLVRRIHHLCRLPGGNVSPPFGPVSHPLGRLGLKDLLQLVLFMAGQLENENFGSPRKLLGNASIKERHRLIAQALPIFEEWPKNFHGLLRERTIGKRSRSGNHESARLSRDFGKFRSSLEQYLTGPKFRFLHRAFEHFLSHEWDGLIDMRSSLMKANPHRKRRWLPVPAAAKRLEISEVWVRNLIEKGVLKGEIRRQGKKSAGMVEAASLDALLREYANAIPLTEMAKLLHVSTHTAAEIARRGRLDVLRGPTADGYREWLFRPGADKRFMAKMLPLFASISAA